MEDLRESSGSSKGPFSSASLLVPNAIWDQIQVDFIWVSREDLKKKKKDARIWTQG